MPYKNNAKREAYHAAYREQHREKARAYAAKWREENRPLLREKARERYYAPGEKEKRREYRNRTTTKDDRYFQWARQFYKLSKSEYEARWAQQEGRCVICRTAFTTRRSAHIDHNHQTGAVRGLLCAHCNRGLGGFVDCVTRLQRAIEYLQADESNPFV